jgi:hypothetical protein
LDWQPTRLADVRALLKAGKSMLASIAIIAITTRSSIKVKFLATEELMRFM